MKRPRTLFQKIWDRHVVIEEPGFPAVLYIDLHLVHEVTSPQAFNELRQRGLPVRRPQRVVATMDHSTPTWIQSIEMADEMAINQLHQLQSNCQEFGITLFDIESPDRGIVHVVGPELGLTQPGMTIVCGDSHTATHGAFGALAFGIGTSEVAHVLASQCLLQYPAKTFQVQFDGILPARVTAKDMILALIAKIGVEGGTGYIVEYTGAAVKALNMEERMTLCNMTIEGGAKAGMVAPDKVTFEYLANCPYAPQGADWETALAYWKTLRSDHGATFDKLVTLDVSRLEPMVTFGTHPGMGIPITQPLPHPEQEPEAVRRAALEKALRYMDLTPGCPLTNQPVDVIFIGSCTNARITDLRQAAYLLAGRKISPGVKMIVVPGSERVRRQAESEGLDRIFKEAGADWRFSGCSMCIAMNGDQLQPGQYAVSTSNRNFEGRQGKGGRTFLASPLTAAASAINGRVTDPRTL